MSDESSGTDRGVTERGGTDQEVVRVEVALPRTVPLSEIHRTADFRCAKSERIQGFFTNECPKFLAHNYCRVYVFPNPADPTQIWGYYTLSPSLLYRETMSNKERKDVPGIPAAPMVLIGFMGKHDGTEKGIGESLIVDAARRVYRNPDMAAWGLMLESEKGPDNPKLWAWYQTQGFKPARVTEHNPKLGVMYAPLRKLIPELAPSR